MDEKVNIIVNNLRYLVPQIEPEGVVTIENMEVIQETIGLIDDCLAICPTSEIDISAQLIEWRFLLKGIKLAC